MKEHCDLIINREERDLDDSQAIALKLNASFGSGNFYHVQNITVKYRWGDGDYITLTGDDLDWFVDSSDKPVSTFTIVPEQTFERSGNDYFEIQCWVTYYQPGWLLPHMHYMTTEASLSFQV